MGHSPNQRSFHHAVCGHGLIQVGDTQLKLANAFLLNPTIRSFPGSSLCSAVLAVSLPVACWPSQATTPNRPF